MRPVLFVLALVVCLLSASATEAHFRRHRPIRPRPTAVYRPAAPIVAVSPGCAGGSRVMPTYRPTPVYRPAFAPSPSRCGPSGCR